jgi:hypothetical protein
LGEIMKTSAWLMYGLIVGAGLGATAVYLAMASEAGQDTMARTTKAGGRIGEGVVDILQKVNEGVEQVSIVLGGSAQRTSDAARSHAGRVGKSARRTVRDVRRVFTSGA